MRRARRARARQRRARRARARVRQEHALLTGTDSGQRVSARYSPVGPVTVQ